MKNARDLVNRTAPDIADLKLRMEDLLTRLPPPPPATPPNGIKSLEDAFLTPLPAKPDPNFVKLLDRLEALTKTEGSAHAVQAWTSSVKKQLEDYQRQHPPKPEIPVQQYMEEMLNKNKQPGFYRELPQDKFNPKILLEQSGRLDEPPGVDAKALAERVYAELQKKHPDIYGHGPAPKIAVVPPAQIPDLSAPLIYTEKDYKLLLNADRFATVNPDNAQDFVRTIAQGGIQLNQIYQLSQKLHNERELAGKNLDDTASPSMS